MEARKPFALQRNGLPAPTVVPLQLLTVGAVDAAAQRAGVTLDEELVTGVAHAGRGAADDGVGAGLGSIEIHMLCWTLPSRWRTVS
jgi:hypothetical protein